MFFTLTLLICRLPLNFAGCCTGGFFFAYFILSQQHAFLLRYNGRRLAVASVSRGCEYKNTKHMFIVHRIYITVFVIHLCILKFFTSRNFMSFIYTCFLRHHHHQHLQPPAPSPLFPSLIIQLSEHYCWLFNIDFLYHINLMFLFGIRKGKKSTKTDSIAVMITLLRRLQYIPIVWFAKSIYSLWMHLIFTMIFSQINRFYCKYTALHSAIARLWWIGWNEMTPNLAFGLWHFQTTCIFAMLKVCSPTRCVVALFPSMPWATYIICIRLQSII